MGTTRTCAASTTSPTGIVWVCAKTECSGTSHYYRPSAA